MLEFSKQECDELKTIVHELDLQSPFTTYTPIPEVMQTYMEFYGFFDTLKTFAGDYYWGGKSVVFEGRNLRVATHYWRSLESKGTVFLVHGLYDHVGMFQKFIRHVLEQSFSVIAIDLPGHGISGGESTKVSTFFDYADAVDQVASFFADEVKWEAVIGVGQSTGAAVLMAHVFQKKSNHDRSMFSALAFLGPLIRQRGWRRSAWVYRLFGAFLQRIPRNFNSMNSHNVDFHDFLRYHDPLQAKHLSVEWIGALYHWQAVFSKQPEIDLPLLLLQGTADKVVDWRGNVKLIQKKFSSAQVSYVQGAMHHLVNESEPWQKVVFASVATFLKRQALNQEEHQELEDASPQVSSIPVIKESSGEAPQNPSTNA